MNKQGYIYILASKPYGTLYIGVTSNLQKRVWKHRTGTEDGFTSANAVHSLVFFEAHDTITSAIEREKQLKYWRRDRKINLIERDNPHWGDLFESLGPA